MWLFTCSTYIPTIKQFGCFLQAMMDRFVQGHFRYGAPHRRKKYLTRLKKELEAYDETGNVEHLMNIANYCYLESECPEHPKSNFDAYAASATRTEEL